MPEKDTLTEQESIPFFPDHVRTELMVIGGILVLAVVVGILGLRFPVGLGEPTDPMNTPMHVKPEWYFVFLYQVLKFIPKVYGSVIPVLALIVIALWPFIDSKPEKDQRIRRLRIAAITIFLLAALALTLWGEMS